MSDGIPNYVDLPAASNGGRSGWGLFGENDSLGLMNLQTPEAVRHATGLVRSGKVFALNTRLNYPDPPLFGRGQLQHTRLKTRRPITSAGGATPRTRSTALTSTFSPD